MVYKIVLVGECGAGKTTLVRALVPEAGDYPGMSVHFLDCKWPCEELVVHGIKRRWSHDETIALWDSDGRPAMNPPDDVLFGDADAIWLVYDLSDEAAFWLGTTRLFSSIARRQLGPKPPIVIFVGTKRDRVTTRAFWRGHAAVHRRDAEQMSGLFRATAHICVAAKRDSASARRLLLRTCTAIEAKRRL